MLEFCSNLQPEKLDPCHINMAFMCFLVTTSVKLLLLCIIRYSHIKIHFFLHSWFALFYIQMANNSGVAFSLLFSIYKTMLDVLEPI